MIPRPMNPTPFSVLLSVEDILRNDFLGIVVGVDDIDVDVDGVVIDDVGGKNENAKDGKMVKMRIMMSLCLRVMVLI